MNARSAFLAVTAFVAWPFVGAAQDTTSRRSATVTQIERLKQPRDFEDADLRETLTRLAREAKISLEIPKEVCGNVTLKIEEPVAPYEALNRLADKTHLFFEPQRDGTYTVWTKADFKPTAGAKPAETPSAEAWLTPGGVASATADMATQLDERMAAYNAKPETAALRAKFCRNFYAALIQEGFTPADALKLTAAAVYPAQTDDKVAASK